VFRDIEKICSSFLAKNNLRFGGAEKFTDNISKISVGDYLQFGVVAQEDISQARLKIGDKKIYRFRNHNFVSYELYNDNQKICSMIISNENDTKPYLAISKLVPNHHKTNLCTDEDFEKLQYGDAPELLYVRENTTNMANWLSLRYNLKIKNLFGTSISGNNEVMNFDYSLYASDNCNKILEIERYPSGSINIFATILMSPKQITSITHNPK
jgi:hypothetical protein